MKYRLDDGSIVKRYPYGKRRVVESIPEPRDLRPPSDFPLGEIVLGLVTAAVAALVVALQPAQGWTGAANGALLAGSLYVTFGMVHGVMEQGLRDRGKRHELPMWHSMIPLALLALVLTTWAASAHGL